VVKHAALTTEGMTTVASWIGLTINASKPKLLHNKNGNVREKLKETEIQKHRNFSISTLLSNKYR
jgi:hypothetical protein